MTREQTTVLIDGLSITALGTLLLLNEEDVIDLAGGWMLALVLAIAGMSLIASGIGARRG